MDNIIDLAEYLFMRGCTQKEIALKVGRSESTVAEWVKKYGWKEKRAVTLISRNEMVSKLLNRIDDLLSAPEGGIDTTELLRISKAIKTLDKELGLTDYIDCFISFGEWLQRHPQHLEEVKALLTARSDAWNNFVKAVNFVQDKFINEFISSK